MQPLQFYVYMREKYSFRAQTKTTYTSALSIKSIRSESIASNITDSNDLHPLQRMVGVLDKKVRNKKRYFFQILKQFILFSDSSMNSSISNVSAYYAVLTGEEKLHSIFKILQTQMIERKIWAFLNLIHWKKARRIAQAVPKCDLIMQKKQMSYKFQGLFAIKQRASEHYQNLSYQRMLNITIVNETPKKSVRNQCVNKSEVNVSKQTDIESYLSQKSMHNRNQYNEFHISNCCEYCHCSISCCCCNSCGNRGRGYNLEQRMEYLRMLEEMAQQYDAR